MSSTVSGAVAGLDGAADVAAGAGASAAVSGGSALSAESARDASFPAQAASNAQAMAAAARDRRSGFMQASNASGSRAGNGTTEESAARGKPAAARSAPAS